MMPRLSWLEWADDTTPTTIGSTADSTTIYTRYTTAGTDDETTYLYWNANATNFQHWNAERQQDQAQLAAAREWRQTQTAYLAAYLNYPPQIYMPRYNGIITNLSDPYLTANFPAQRVPLPRARAKARRLLKRTLTDAQRDMLRRLGYFEVESQSGRIYRIRTGIAQNVFLLDAKGREVERLCAHPVLSVPDFDAMLSQKLMLEAAEEDFRGIANKVILPAAA